MESEVTEVPFSAQWESVVAIAGNPGELFPSFPYRVRLLSSGERIIVSLSVRRFLMKFDFEGVLEFTFGEPFVTYVMKGRKGLLILSFAAEEGALLARASADIAGERRLRRKLHFLAAESGKTLARMAESYELVAPKIIGSPADFVVQNFNPSLLPHIIRYVRLKLGKPSFALVGSNGGERFSVTIRDNVVERVEHEGPTGSAIIEVGKGVLDVTEDDFPGIDATGRYEIRIPR
ncbi:hypothetical protein [Thermococcus thermotolerans]|uniref:hypothetical protein n=1 Tax=Thermococcus thermotolerans TaxID=2969672 RepID=UPI0021579C29|nr:hypothetical protein [Thermococcus thermotolerans]